MKKEILVVEASNALRFLMHTILRKHYKVVSVSTATAAMHYLQHGNRPHLIISEPLRDDIPAWEFEKHLSLNPLFRDIPLVAVSSVEEQSLHNNARKFGFAACFAKPFNPVKLLQQVDLLLVGGPVIRY